MQHFYIRKAGILLAKSAFLLCGLGAIWMMLSLVEPGGVYPWWLVVLASVGAFALGCVFLLGALICEEELKVALLAEGVGRNSFFGGDEGICRGRPPRGVRG